MSTNALLKSVVKVFLVLSTCVLCRLSLQRCFGTWSEISTFNFNRFSALQTALQTPKITWSFIKLITVIFRLLQTTHLNGVTTHQPLHVHQNMHVFAQSSRSIFCLSHTIASKFYNLHVQDYIKASKFGKLKPPRYDTSKSTRS